MLNSGWPYLAVRRLLPSAISLPKPVPLAVMSAKSHSALAEPKGDSTPSCSFVSTPISNSSITAPMVAPKVIGSMPCSLQMVLAYCSASRSLTPLAAPRAQAASYSKPPVAPQYCGLLATEKWVGSILLMRPQAMVQPKQAWLVTNCALPSLLRGAAMASAPMSLAPSNWMSRWLRVGSAPISLMTFISTWVPKVGRPWPVTALSARIFFFS